MNDDELDALLRGAVRHDPSRAGDALRTAGPELLEEIMSQPVPSPARPEPTEVAEIEVGSTPGARSPSPRTSRRRALVIAAVAAVVAAVVAVPAYVFRGGGEQSVAVTPAAPSLGLRNDPDGTRVLVDEAGWKITYASQSAPDMWEVQLTKGRAGLQINGYPAGQLGDYRDDRKVTGQTTTVPVLGVDAPLIEEGKDDWEVLVPPKHGQMLDIRGGLGRADFVDLLTRLRRVSDDTFGKAMPAAFVTPDREVRVAREMLRDVPLPAGMKASHMTSGNTNDRYQFGAFVTGKVVCRWIELDLRARAAGDEAAQAEADQAMASSHDWAVLHEMNDEGDYPEVVWEYADALSTGAPVPGGSDKVDVANSYKDAFGCA